MIIRKMLAAVTVGCSLIALGGGASFAAGDPAQGAFNGIDTHLQSGQQGAIAQEASLATLAQDATTLATDILALKVEDYGTPAEMAKLAELARVVTELQASIAAASPQADPGEVAFLADELGSLQGQFAALKKKMEGLVAGSGPVFDVKKLRPTFQSFSAGQGNFQLRAPSRIIVTDEALIGVLTSSMGWAEKLRLATGLQLKVVNETPRPGDIILSNTPAVALTDAAETAKFTWKTTSKPIKDVVLREGYTYVADKDNLRITFSNNLGGLNGLKTAYQLLAIDQRQPGAHRWLPTGSGVDYPIRKYRGLMVDVGRQFVSVADLIGIMDKMSYYKLNLLHIHLSDNVGDGSGGVAPQGGPNGYVRLYDESMPEDLKPLKPKDSPSDGADRTYYTKADIKTLETAAARYGIELLPEIDTPGHSYAFTNVFPAFASPGDKSVINVNNPDAVAFMKRAMVEYFGWFSTNKIHIGGDEAYRTSRRDLDRYLVDLKAYLAGQGLGAEFIGAWNNYSTPPGPPIELFDFNWTNARTASLAGRPFMDVSDSRYFVPFKEKGDYNSLGLAPQQIFATTERGLNDSGIPIGSLTAVWNDFGEKYRYEFETINAGIARSFPGSAVAWWSGLPLNTQGSVIPYAQIAAENITASREYTSSWLRNRFPTLGATQALEILQRTSNHRGFKLEPGNQVPKLVTSTVDPTDPLGWDPLDMAAAFAQAQSASTALTLQQQGIVNLP